MSSGAAPGAGLTSLLFFGGSDARAHLLEFPEKILNKPDFNQNFQFFLIYSLSVLTLAGSSSLQAAAYKRTSSSVRKSVSPGVSGSDIVPSEDIESLRSNRSVFGAFLFIESINFRRGSIFVSPLAPEGVVEPEAHVEFGGSICFQFDNEYFRFPIERELFSLFEKLLYRSRQRADQLLGLSPAGKAH